MKCLVVIFGVLALVSADTYSTENDNLDIEALLANKKAHQSFVDCFLDLQPCDEVQTDFKDDLPEAICSACAKCTEPQKHILNRFLAVTKTNLPQGYNALRSKYDTTGTCFPSLEQAIAKA